MQQYWEITHERAVDTQAVWGMQPTFELNGLTFTQHGTLTDSLPVLAQTRDNKENDLTEALASKHAVFAKLVNLAIRVPGLIDGLLEDNDPLKEQLDAVYGVDADASANSGLRRARIILPLWTDVNTARAAAVPAKAALTIDYQGTSIAVADFSTTIDAPLASQKTEAERQRDVTNSKTALPITALTMTVGPFTPGSTVNFRTRVSNSNPGFVTSDVVSVVVQ